MKIPTAEEQAYAWEVRTMKVLGTSEQGKPEHSLANFFRELGIRKIYYNK